jgi:glucose/arabinose dehydrogenase
VEGETIFRAEPMRSTNAHYGARLAFLPDGTLLMTAGEGFAYREEAQVRSNHLGAVLRLNPDGSAPRDNPFADEGGRRSLCLQLWPSEHARHRAGRRDGNDLDP